MFVIELRQLPAAAAQSLRALDTGIADCTGANGSRNPLFDRIFGAGWLSLSEPRNTELAG
jgi:hypothetical protein